MYLREDEEEKVNIAKVIYVSEVLLYENTLDKQDLFALLSIKSILKRLNRIQENECLIWYLLTKKERKKKTLSKNFLWVSWQTKVTVAALLNFFGG